MKRYFLVFSVLLVVVLYSTAPAQNVILNGDFDNGFENWNFENASTTYPGCASAGMYAYAEAQIVNGMGRIHGFSAYGNGYLRQTFIEVQPAEISFYYRGGMDPTGYAPGCGSTAIFFYQGGTEIFLLGSSNFTHTMNQNTHVRFLGELRYLRFGTTIQEGNVRLIFDYFENQMQVWINNNLETTFYLPLDVKVDQTALYSTNSCCDGRNNQYSYFDNISVVNVSANHAPLIEPIGNKTTIEGGLLEFTILAVDPDGDTLTYSASNLPPGATFDSITQTFSWIPNFEQSGVYFVTFKVIDSKNPPMEASETIKINVGEVPSSSNVVKETTNIIKYENLPQGLQKGGVNHLDKALKFEAENKINEANGQLLAFNNQLNEKIPPLFTTQNYPEGFGVQVYEEGDRKIYIFQFSPEILQQLTPMENYNVRYSYAHLIIWTILENEALANDFYWILAAGVAKPKVSNDLWWLANENNQQYLYYRLEFSTWWKDYGIPVLKIVSDILGILDIAKVFWTTVAYQAPWILIPFI